MAKIKNYNQLISCGELESRKIVLDITERTLEKLDAYKRIKSIMYLDDYILHIGTESWDLSTKENVYLIGAGKACNHMARAVDELLGDHLTKGIAIVKILEDTDVFSHTDVYVGGHPLPNQNGYEACLKILDLVDQAGPNDLFIAVMSGGSSSLMSCPIDGITLDDEILTTDVLLKSGAGIYEINAVRRHISATNGGMLAKRIQKTGAQLIGIGISDAVGNPATTDISIPYPQYSSTPIGPDKTTLADARQVLEDFHLADRLPASVVNHILTAGPAAETPKEFPDNTYFLLNTLPDSCIYAKEIAEQMGFHAIILTSFLEGESKDAGSFFASIAREVQSYGNPFPAPCVILSSGEVTTQILDNTTIQGHGGPSMELTSGFALLAAKTKGACMLSIDSEGTDGTSPAAGGITDSSSLARALSKDINFHHALRTHSCYEALQAIGDDVFTGNTGTNLCDFNILYIPAKGSSL